MKTLKPIKWVKKSENNWSGGKNIVIRKCQDYFRAYIKIDDVFTSSPKFKTLETTKNWVQSDLQIHYNVAQKAIEEIESEVGIEN